MARQQQQQQPPQNTNQIAVIQQHQLQALQGFTDDLHKYAHRFRDALPNHIPVERFERVVVTAVANNTDLLVADRRSLFNACMRAAADGLVPDGREGVLVVYRSTVRLRDPVDNVDRETKMDVVQWTPMIAGIRKRLHNSGEVHSFIAEAVYEKDTFRYRLGDDPFIEHAPPPLGADRGAVVGAYAIIRLRNGEVIRDVMDRKTIELARGQSRSKDSLMWREFYHEAAKKVVARRAAKQAPFSADLERLFHRDVEELPDLGGEDRNYIDHDQPQQPARETEQNRQIEPRTEAQQPPPPPPPPADTEFAVVDLDGTESIFSSGFRACQALEQLLAEAERRGRGALEGFWESNQPTIDLLEAKGFREQVTATAQEYSAALRRISMRTTPPPDQTGATDGGGQQQQQAGAEQGGNAVDSGTPDRQSLFVEPVVTANGNVDWRTWLIAKFLPKLRRQRDGTTMAFLLGDNEENLAKARGALGKDDLNELEVSIKEQWRLVGP